MTLRDYTANVISASKVVPDGAFQNSAASGVWDINEALDLIKGGNWPTTGSINPSAFVDNLFQTHVYDGNGGTQSIVNNIDLSGSGGLVWTKRRDSSSNGDHTLYDTETGTGGRLRSNNNQQAYSPTDAVTAFNNNGFSIGADASINTNGAEYVSWTFRKQPKFFDVVTYTGNGSAGNTVNHSLGSVPGMILFKRRDATASWWVYHRGVDASAPEDYYLRLESTAARADSQGLTNDTAPTSTVITLGSNTAVNASGGSYVAYLFAHNNNDGGFGEPKDQDIIKCGSYTGNGSSTGPSVNLGFEPQFVMIKSASGSEGWYVYDNMRGMIVGGDDAELAWNLDTEENGILGTSKAILDPTPTGFNITNTSSTANTSSHTYVYMAIRRGGMQTPSTPSDVFDVNTHSNNSNSNIFNTGFNPDMNINTRTAAAGNYILSRLTGPGYLQTDITDAEVTSSNTKFFDKGNNLIDLGTNWFSQNDVVSWSWKRARGYFDAVAYTGSLGATNFSGTTSINHNLGVTPEMIWIKSRSNTPKWCVGSTHFSSGGTLALNENSALEGVGNTDRFVYADWSTTAFKVGNNDEVNRTGYTYIAYLFATLAGVSKVGTYTGNDTGQNIDCGFSNGARFVLIKCSSHGDRSWMVFDSVRGIVAGADPFLILEHNAAQNYAYNGAGSLLDYSSSNLDLIDPYSAGFAVVGGTGMVNENGKSYIFYAIANDPS